MNTALLDSRHLIAQKGRFQLMMWQICCVQRKLTHEHMVSDTKHPVLIRRAHITGTETGHE